MINRVFLLGNLGSDPKIKYTRDGLVMVVLRLATNEFIRQNGSYKKITDWHTVLAFGKLAEFCSSHLRKGDRIFVEGKLRSSTFEVDNKIIKASSVVARAIKIIPRSAQKDELSYTEIARDGLELSKNGVISEELSPDEIESEEEIFDIF
jgi:single-strand DNA-binding protein